MALFHCNYYSKYLSYRIPVTVILPVENKKEQVGNYKTLYLLHGRGDDCNSWCTNTRIELLAEKYQIAVVMPTAEDSFYTDAITGKKFFSFMTIELPDLMERTFPITRNAKKRYIAGLSMGGYGALKIGLTYPEKFSAIGAFSAAVVPTEMPDFCETDLDKENLRSSLIRTFGNQEIPDKDNIYSLLEKKGIQVPSILIYEGKQDFLYQMNYDFYQYLQQHHFEVHYEEWDGKHDWQFWDLAIEKFLVKLFE